MSKEKAGFRKILSTIEHLHTIKIEKINEAFDSAMLELHKGFWETQEAIH